MTALILTLIIISLLIAGYFLHSQHETTLEKVDMKLLEEKARCEILKDSMDAIIQKYIEENMKFLKTKLSPNNFNSQKDKLKKMGDFLKKNSVKLDENSIEDLEVELKSEFEKIVRLDYEKQEQNRIKQRIKEEVKYEKEREAEIRKIENEKTAIEKALEKALGQAKGEHDQEVDRLREKLEEAEGRFTRAKSMAELTKAGYVYVISNLGSFGKHVYKVGMTRRLKPMDRVKELGDASVPFPFDVHMMISCENAPELESKLHQALNKARVNKVNLRKEFFRVKIDSIKNVVEKLHGKVEYQASPEALDYFESQKMTEEEFEFRNKLAKS